MSDTALNNDELVDLLIKESTEGLSDAEAADLERLAASLTRAEREELEHAATTAMLASLGPLERMPDTTRQRVLKSVPKSAASAARPAHRKASTAGWWVAAACFALAAVGWYPRLEGELVPIAQTQPDPFADRERLMQQQGTMKAAWSTGPAGPQPVHGDVVFDPATQRGYLRFRGLPANDPRREQYQLWIADSTRPAPEPVDGGVFDVATTAPNGDVIVPFHAKLPVGHPAAFVVTAERPGGVVVSRQERVLALAKPEPKT